MIICSGAPNAVVSIGGHRPPLQLFADDGECEFSPMRRAPMLKEKNALPRSKLHFSVGNRHCLTGARQDHADVRWHVIAALGSVREIICVFRHEAIEELFQIAPRSWIGILHHDHAATGVLDKNSHSSIAHAAPVDLRLHFVSNFVQSLSVGADLELIVMHGHTWTLPGAIL